MFHSLGLAVIGCGNFARRQHLPNLARVPGARLVGVCDIDAATAEAARRDFGAEYATTELARVLGDTNVAAVVICVRDDLQAAIGLAALRAGKDVYIEKPVAENDVDFRTLIEARDAMGRQVAVGFNKRFAPAYVKGRGQIAAAGGAHLVVARMADDAWRWASGYAPGSLLRHDACHLFDLARWLVGDRISRVYAAAARADDDTVVLSFAGGAVATVINSGHATMDFPKERLEVITSRGVVTVDDFVELRTFGSASAPAVTTFRGLATRSSRSETDVVEKLGERGLAGMLEVRRAIWAARAAGGRTDHEDAGIAAVLPNFIRDQGWFHAMEAFVQTLQRGDRLPHATLEDAWAAARVVDAAELSRASGMPQELGSSGEL